MINKIDLTVMPSGERYEDRYGRYMGILLEVFRKMSVVVNPPYSWIPLIWWMGGMVERGQVYFKHDLVLSSLIDTGLLTRQMVRSDRTLLEMFCTIRPELTDVLWKVDYQYRGEGSGYIAISNEKDFIITNNGSYHRDEVLDYMNTLIEYKPTKQKCILVPCAADKPYPSRLHSAILEFMPEDYHIIVATGVLGLVPMELWDQMPHYDSGMPNEWRLMKWVEQYFLTHEYKKIVVYCDYYNEAIYRGLVACSAAKVFINPIQFYADYLDLLDKDRLDSLRRSL
jgi:hypothetical protein